MKRKAYILKSGEGRTTVWHDVPFIMKAAAKETGGQFALWDVTTRPGEEPHVHIHDDVDEIFYVLKGDITFQAGDGRGATRFRVKDGAFVYIPLGTPHTYEIHSRTVRMLGISAPSVFGDHIERTGVRVVEEGPGSEKGGRVNKERRGFTARAASAGDSALTHGAELVIAGRSFASLRMTVTASSVAPDSGGAR